MGRRVSIPLYIEKRTKATFGLSHFTLNSSHFHSNCSVFHLCNDVSCCNKGKSSANRGRGEGRARGGQMFVFCGSSFPLSGPHNYRSHHCFRSAVVQTEHFLSTAAAQNCKNLRPEKMWVWSLRPEFWVPHRNWASRTGSLDIKSVPEKSESEEEEEKDDDGDQVIERNDGNNLVMYEHSDQAVVDLMEVERVYKVVEELFASDRNMEAVLDQCDVKLSHSLVYHVLIRFSHARKPAFRFFNWAEQQVGFSHNSLTYNTMMSILARTKQFVTMCELLEEMGKKGSVLTIETFEITIKAFAAAREMKKAVQMFDLMERYDFDANLNAFNFMLDALGRVKLAKEAQMLFERMRGRFPPNARTYTALISGWCEAKNLIEAGKLWNEMIDEGFEPDVVTHNIMLGGLFKGSKKDEALKLFELMKTNGPSSNSKSYTIVIRALSKLQKMEEASKFFAEMQEHGSPLDAAIYTCLITGYGNTKKLDKAYELLQEMKEKGIRHDCRSYNALIKVMMVLHKPDEATKLFEKMIQCGFQPTIHTYNMLMKLYFRARNPGMGFAIWHQMARNDCCPDVNSYTMFIGGLIREGRSDKACAYIESMIDKGELHLYPVTVKGPCGEKLELQINPGDSMMDLWQFLLDAPETYFYTCYDLIMVMKDGSRYQLVDYLEIGDVGDISTGGCSLDMFTALYDDRSVRSHVRRIRDVVSTPSLHSSLSTTFAMEYEANQHSPGGENDGKSTKKPSWHTLNSSTPRGFSGPSRKGVSFILI